MILFQLKVPLRIMEAYFVLKKLDVKELNVK
jgi:hypothetical protein